MLTGHGPRAASATDCTPRTAWAGAESPGLSGQFLDQWPATVPVRLTDLTVSWAYAPTGPATPAFREALLLAGTSPGAVHLDGPTPPLTAALDWGAPSWETNPPGQPVSGNGQVSGNVLAARILKTAGGVQSAADSVTVPVDVTLPAGGVLWVFAGTVPGFDVEVQTVVTYLPGGC